jgi:hypothetical protein
MRSSRRIAAFLALASFVLGCVLGVPAATAGGAIDVGERSRVLVLLEELGIVDGGVYTPPASGMSNPLTEDLDAGGFDINNLGRIDSDGTIAVGADLDMEGNDITDATSVNLVGGASTYTFDADRITGPTSTTIKAGTYLGFECGATTVASFSAATASIAPTVSANVVSTPMSRTSASGTTLNSGTQAVGHSYNNTGATALVPFTLGSAFAGARVTFLVTDADGIRINLDAGDSIVTPGFTSTTYIHSTRIGSQITLLATSADEWQAETVSGTWRNGSTTSAGFAFTPTARIAYTPTATWTGPNISTTGYYVHDGATCHVSARVEMAGDATGGTYLAVSLPLAIDETAMALTTAYASVGGFSYFDSGTAHYSYPVIIIASSNNAYAKTNVTGVDTFFSRGGSPVTPANNDRALFTFSYAVTQ